MIEVVIAAAVLTLLCIFDRLINPATIEFRFLRLWFRLPDWVTADAPLPLREWVDGWQARSMMRVTAHFEALTVAFDRMADAARQAAVAIEAYVLVRGLVTQKTSPSR